MLTGRPVFASALTVILINIVVLAAASSTAGSTAGYFQEYSLGSPASGPAIVAIDENDNVWVAVARLGKLAMLANGSIRTFDLGADSRPVGIAIGSASNGQAGSVWIAASYDNKLIRFDIYTHQKREYKIDGNDSWPFNLAIGKDGGIWFTERASGKVGRLDPATGKIQHYEPPTRGAGPAGLAVSSQTGKVWFTESYADRIGILDPSSGEIREIKMGDKSTGLTTGPAGLCIDSDGGVWFSKLDGKLGHIASGSETIEIIDLPAEVRRPAGITAAKGDVWAAALDGNLLLRYHPATHEFSTFPLPTGAADLSPAVPPNARTARPFGIAVDGQGNVWFSEQYTGKLGVLDVAPPGVKIGSPGGSVRTVFPVLSVEASDRVSGVSELKLTVDGRPAAAWHGYLDLRNVSPGKHTLQVIAVDRAGLQSQAESTFSYDPGPLALMRWLDTLTPKDAAGEQIKASLLGLARDVSKGDARLKLEQIRMALNKNRDLFSPFADLSLSSLIDYIAKNASQIVEVQILDSAPYFYPPETSIAAGDTVSWKYAAMSDGHTLSSELHRVEVVGKARSELLRSGESFSYRFEDPGEYSIRDERNGQAKALIKVSAK